MLETLLGLGVLLTEKADAEKLLQAVEPDPDGEQLALKLILGALPRSRPRAIAGTV
jgi:hypothetical protein